MTEAAQQAQEAPRAETPATAGAPTAKQAKTAAKFQRNLAVQFEESAVQGKTGATIANATANLIERQQTEIERQQAEIQSLKAALAAATAGASQEATEEKSTALEGEAITLSAKQAKLLTELLNFAEDVIAHDKKIPLGTANASRGNIHTAAQLLRKAAEANTASSVTVSAKDARSITNLLNRAVDYIHGDVRIPSNTADAAGSNIHLAVKILAGAAKSEPAVATQDKPIVPGKCTAPEIPAERFFTTPYYDPKKGRFIPSRRL